MKQAYDYWQDQPDFSLVSWRRGRLSSNSVFCCIFVLSLCAQRKQASRRLFQSDFESEQEHSLLFSYRTTRDSLRFSRKKLNSMLTCDGSTVDHRVPDFSQGPFGSTSCLQNRKFRASSRASSREIVASKKSSFSNRSLQWRINHPFQSFREQSTKLRIHIEHGVTL